MNAPELPENTDQPATPTDNSTQETLKPGENEETTQEPTPLNADSKPSNGENDQTANMEKAVAGARADALAIAELCQLAGQTHRIAGFLAEGASPEQVRQRLLAIRAETPEIASRIHPDAQGQASSPEHGPLMKAVRRMIGQ
jgi:hypothetical protein